LNAGKTALSRVQQYITSQQSFIVESTISGRVYLRYLNNAKQVGFKTILIYVALSSADLSAERVAMRVSLGGHSIPAEDIIRRYPKSMQNLKEHIRLCDLAYIYDNSQDYELIATYRKGTIYRQPCFYKKPCIFLLFVQSDLFFKVKNVFQQINRSSRNHKHR